MRRVRRRGGFSSCGGDFSIGVRGEIPVVLARRLGGGV